MTKDIQPFCRIYDRNPHNSIQDKQKEKRNNNHTIKEDFKNSIAHWQCKKKVDKLIRKLLNTT